LIELLQTIWYSRAAQVVVVVTITAPAAALAV
jgi:hypothetical protein